MYQITVNHNDYRGEHFCNGRPDKEVFYKQFQTNVIQYNAPPNGDSVSNQLNPSPQRRIDESDIFGQQKAGAKGYGKNKNKGSDIWTDDYKTQIHVLLVEDEVVKDEIKKNIQHRVESTSSSITESFRRNHPAKGLVYPAYELQKNVVTCL